MEKEDKGDYRWFAGPGILAPYAIYASADLLEHDYSKFAKRTAVDVPIALSSIALLEFAPVTAAAGPATATAVTNATVTNAGRLVLTSPGTKGFLQQTIRNLLRAYGSAPPEVKKQISNKVAERLIYGNVGRELTNLVTGVGVSRGFYDFFIDGPFDPTPAGSPGSVAGFGAGETLKDMLDKYDQWKENSKKEVKQDAPKSNKRKSK